MSIFFILSQAAAGEAPLAALGKGGNASAIATAPRPIAAEPTYIQVYRPKVSKIQPPAAGPSAIPRLETTAAAPNPAPTMRCPKRPAPEHRRARTPPP